MIHHLVTGKHTIKENYLLFVASSHLDVIDYIFSHLDVIDCILLA